MSHPLILFGTGEAAELAHYYFTYDSAYRVIAFTVDEAYLSVPEFKGLPVVPFSQLANEFPPHAHDLFIAIGYSQLNQIRKERYTTAKTMGYKLATYLSSRATVPDNAHFGDNCMVLEQTLIQPYVTIGNNVVVGCGSSIGHHSLIDDHCYMASSVVVSGGVHIGESCFIGGNATLRNHITIGNECMVGAGAVIMADAKPRGVYLGEAAKRSRIPSHLLTRLASISEKRDQDPPMQAGL